ncbi:MAG: twitching motility protein PilT [Actinomycetota bacterium]
MALILDTGPSCPRPTGATPITSAAAPVVEDLVAEDHPRVRELIDRYDDLGVGFVDAAVLAVVERLGEPKPATLDRRHFSVMRPRHVDSLELLPA